MKYLKIQRRLFRRADRDLFKEEYRKLLETATNLGKARLALLMEVICATGIRASEVKYITVEAAQMGRAEVPLKGKVRTILIQGKPCCKLQKYAKKQKIVSGEIFLTRNEKGLSRRQIWAEMKALCRKAGVASSKVLPHNLRHLFAKTLNRAGYKVKKRPVQKELWFLGQNRTATQENFSFELLFAAQKIRFFTCNFASSVVCY